MKSELEIINLMLNQDRFSNLLNVQLIEIRKGFCIVGLEVKDKLVNGFDIAHGGITYSLADTAAAFAANSYGNKAMSIESSISHIQACKKNDFLIATTSEISRNRKFGIYAVEVKTKKDSVVAHYKGNYYFSEKKW